VKRGSISKMRLRSRALHLRQPRTCSTNSILQLALVEVLLTMSGPVTDEDSRRLDDCRSLPRRLGILASHVVDDSRATPWQNSPR